MQFKPRKLLNFRGSKNNYPEFQVKQNIIKLICDKAIQIRKAVESGFNVVIPAIEVNYFDMKMKIIAISEDGFKADGNDNILEYVWLEKKELNKVLQILMKIKLPKFAKLPHIADNGELITIEVERKLNHEYLYNK